MAALKDGESPPLGGKGANRSHQECQRSRGDRLIYRNDVLWTAGLFELTNALDFPATVWNNVPIPIFAQVLMGVGGSICLLWTTFGTWDFLRSRQNIVFLLRERKALLAQRQNTNDHAPLVEAWLDVNYRELGWEIIDRALMDVLMSVSSILVGIGTLVAIRGDVHEVFETSDLLSGYVGNSFCVVYAAANLGWAVFMWRRASRMVCGIRRCEDPMLRKRMLEHAFEHRLYAVLNGLAVAVSSVGAMTVVGSSDIDVSGRLKTAALMQADKSRKERLNLEHLSKLEEGTSRQALMDIIKVCCAFKSPESQVLEMKAMAKLELEPLRSVAEDYLAKVDVRNVRDHERFLLELYGCILTLASDSPKQEEETEK